ncbi:ion channel [Melghirimyces profundicolus]|uniref:Ion channel n=1 Tax=Melghirimyces profundicolus TaxID=1242148 RepID=A0A2T6BU66_9BACL|nr:ion channel [Melghirimyces profundicolus]
MQLSVIVATVIILWGSGGIYVLESEINEGIENFSDAIWWAVVTTTTVGYGGISPATFGGRMIGVVLMITGIGLIGSVTASVAAHFSQVLIQQRRETHSPENRVRGELLTTAKEYLNRIDRLTPEEYRTLLQLLETLRVSGDPDSSHPPSASQTGSRENQAGTEPI